jgi:hypothetical protein
MSDRTKKLVSIRHRTDHDLLILVSRELDRGFALGCGDHQDFSPLRPGRESICYGDGVVAPDLRFEPR